MRAATDEFVSGYRISPPRDDAKDAVFRVRTDAWACRPLDYLNLLPDEPNPHPRYSAKRTRNQMRDYSAAYLRRWCREFPTVAQKTLQRNAREQFISRLEEVTR